jgi:ribosome-associated protein
MDGDVVTPGGIVVPADAITWRFSRGTGPGGQGVNTTDSRVELVVDLIALQAPAETLERIRAALGDSLRIVAATERSQLRNREAALKRLSVRLDRAATPPARATRPGEPAPPCAGGSRPSGAVRSSRLADATRAATSREPSWEDAAPCQSHVPSVRATASTWSSARATTNAGSGANRAATSGCGTRRRSPRRIRPRSTMPPGEGRPSRGADRSPVLVRREWPAPSTSAEASVSA